MCKTSFVTLARGKKKYKLVSTDIANVHTIIRKKRPAIPKYETTTSDEIIKANVVEIVNTWYYDCIFFLISRTSIY